MKMETKRTPLSTISPSNYEAAHQLWIIYTSARTKLTTAGLGFKLYIVYVTSGGTKHIVYQRE